MVTLGTEHIINVYYYILETGTYLCLGAWYTPYTPGSCDTEYNTYAMIVVSRVIYNLT